MWVKSEYAGEVAVLSTWLSAFLPWSVSVFRPPVEAADLTAIWLRFLPGRFLYVFGPFERSSPPWDWVWAVPGFVETQGELFASYVWLAGCLVFLVALAISVLYYFDEDRVESWQFDPVRTLGWLLAGSAVVLGVASGLLAWFQAGLTLPVGALVQFGLGVVLLRAERT